MEATAQEDEFGNLANVVVGVMHLAHTLARHLGADHLVVVERHALAGQHFSCAWLANVVIQGSQSRNAKVARHVGLHVLYHGERMGEYVLVPVDWILLQGKGRQLGQESIGETRLHRESQPIGDVAGHDHSIEFVANTLR